MRDERRKGAYESRVWGSPVIYVRPHKASVFGPAKRGSFSFLYFFFRIFTNIVPLGEIANLGARRPWVGRQAPCRPWLGRREPVAQPTGDRSPARGRPTASLTAREGKSVIGTPSPRGGATGGSGRPSLGRQAPCPLYNPHSALGGSFDTRFSTEKRGRERRKETAKPCWSVHPEGRGERKRRSLLGW